MKTLTENYYFDTSKPNAACKIGVQLTELLLKTDRPLDDVIIICIGTDRSTGDSLGPIVGYKLSKALRKSGKKQQKNGITVYGTLSSPVHATNLESILSEIYFRHSKPFCIAVDASLGTQGHIGYVTVGTGPLKPGLGVNKQLPDVGDLHITGIVNLSGTNDPMLLQTKRLNVVMELADIIVTGLLYCLDPIHSVQKPHISFFNPIKLSHYFTDRQTE